MFTQDDLVTPPFLNKNLLQTILKLFSSPIIIFNFFLVDVCRKYKSLDSADRKDTYTGTEDFCDSDLTEGWYRFEGEAGTKMLTTCVKGNKCGTIFPGWLKANHPTVADGVKEGYVCFQKRGQCEASCPFKIKVKNCTSHYIYKLYPIGGCPGRYCGTD